MEKKNKEMEKENKINMEIVRRKDYIFLVNFFNEIKNLDLEKDSNKKIVKDLYFKFSENKFSNIKRVINRSLRKEIKENLLNELKENNMSIEEYMSIGEKLKIMSKKNKSNNFNLVKIEN
jgi:hypothetical protein